MNIQNFLQIYTILRIAACNIFLDDPQMTILQWHATGGLGEEENPYNT